MSFCVSIKYLYLINFIKIRQWLGKSSFLKIVCTGCDMLLLLNLKPEIRQDVENKGHHSS